jgi:pyruvate kinase
VLAEWFNDLHQGDQISLVDARGRHRVIRIVKRASCGAWAEADKTAYVVPNTKIYRQSSDGETTSKPGRIGALAQSQQFLVMHRGDRVLLGDCDTTGSPATYDQHGKTIRPATIGCTLPAVFRDLKRSDRVLFDDGKITACVEEVHQQHAVLKVISASPTGTKLKSDKGINLPDTHLHLDAVTEKDISDLQFVVENADMVGYSFVRTAEDVERLQSELARLGRPEMPIVLKIENRQAFDHLPSILLTAMRSPSSGVMIARGDLAVELGWQRLAEVQEEILWMCEAAHMPVIWATQVLESLAKTGTPSRAEITDAAMSVRAECVMLNKGPYILEAVRLLVEILRRMQDHQIKKRPLLRRLRLADDLMPAEIALPETRITAHTR